MSDDRWVRCGAAAGAIAIVLFAIGAVLVGDRPAFDAPGAEIAAQLEAHRTRIQVAGALFALVGPLFVWFLATAVSIARPAGAAARRAASVAFGCGLIFVTLFLADVTALAVSALRPENMAASPELAVALRDFELLAMGVAAFAAAAMLAAFAVLVLRDNAIWPRWLGLAAAIAAAAYALRTGTLFTYDGPFAADGVLGLYIPVTAIAGWTLAASVVLARNARPAGRT